jgi:WD40 repeat protein
MQTAKVIETNVKSLKFSPTRNSIRSFTDRRLLSSNESRISVWQLEELKLFAEIENLEPGTLNVEFGADENEILVFHAWNTKMTIHSLDTWRSSMIKSPKSSHPLGFGYRPQTKHFAILLKPDASDLLTIHDPQSYNLVSRVVLSTNDAQGLKWSPDGRWIAVWDAASSGTKVLIFTADGQLFRTYSGPSEMDDSFDLGVKQIEWGPVGKGGTSNTLAVGKVNGNVDLLRTRTVCTSSKN